MPSSSHVHTIRLRRPWQKLVDGQSNSLRIDIPEAEPDRQSVNAADAIASYQRPFNRPTGIASQTQVKLEIGTCDGTVHAITLNDHSLPTDLPSVVDITHQLEDHNRLCLRIGPDPSGRAARLVGPINLLIHETSETAPPS